MTASIRRVKFAIIYWELLGFLLAALLLWLDELFDFPYHLLGAPATPINWRESILESVSVMILAAVVVTMTYRALRRIRYLEEFMRICPSCKRVFSGGVWISMDQYLAEQTEVRMLRGLCSYCETPSNPCLTG